MLNMNQFLSIDRVPNGVLVCRYSQRSDIDWEAITLALLCEHAGVDEGDAYYEVLDRMNPATVTMHSICADEGDI